MPFIYAVDPAGTIATSATPNTENDCLFVKPGTRNLAIQALYIHGKGAGLTALSGITTRLKKWGTTASATGTGTALTTGLTGTVQQRDPGAQNAKTTGAFSLAAAPGLTAGTGGPGVLLTIGCGAAGPGGWVAPNVDSTHVLEGSANQSIDLFNSSGTASLNFSASLEVVE